MSVRNPGRLTKEGDAKNLYSKTNINPADITDITTAPGGFEKGYGLFSFSHDYNMDSTPVETDTDFIVINDDVGIDIYDPNENGGADFRESHFGLGSRTGAVKPEYYNVDGALRVCDSNFLTTDTTETVDMTGDVSITKNDIELIHTSGTIPAESIIQIDQEIMYVTATNGSTTIDVIRGFANTKIATHAHNSKIYFVNVPKYFGHIKHNRLFECDTPVAVNTWVEDIQTPQPPNNTRKSDGATGTLANSAGIQSLRIYDEITASTTNIPAESEKVVLEFGEGKPNIGITQVEADADGVVTITCGDTHSLAVGEEILISNTNSAINSIRGTQIVETVDAANFKFTINIEDYDTSDVLDFVESDKISSITDWADLDATTPNTISVDVGDTDLPTSGQFYIQIKDQTGIPAFNGVYLATAIDNNTCSFVNSSHASASSGDNTGTVQQLIGTITVVGEDAIDEGLKRKWNFAMSFTYDGPAQEVQESLLTQGHKITPVTRTDNGGSNLLTAEVDNSTDPVTVPVDDGTDFLAGDIIMLGTEQLKVGAVSSNNLTGCVRKFNNTGIDTHADDTQVFKVEELTPAATVDWTNFTVAPKCVIKSVYGYGTDEKSWNARINGFKIYMRDVTDGDASKEFRLFSEVNFNKGTYTIFAADDSELILEQPATHAIATLTTGTTLKIKPIDTYLSENLFTEQTIIDAQYKVAEVVGRRVYIGNVKQGGRTYPDRMLRSPVNKFDTFPETNFIDVAIGDGDRITALKSFGDRLLQYKRDAVYVINTSGESEVLEAEYPNAGVAKPSQVVKTNLGIAWFNPSGLWFFDGQSIQNLTRNIEANQYPDHEVQIGIIGFDKYTNRVIYTPQVNSGLATIWYMYDLELKSYQRYYSGDLFAHSESGANHYTNMITDADGNLIIGYVDNATPTELNFYQWSNNASEGQSISITDVWKSKDIDLLSPAVNKKIYKVYVTYKCTGHSGVKMTYATDGSASFTGTFAASTNYNAESFSTNGTHTGFKNTNGSWAVAELKPSSSINNVKSIQLFLEHITIQTNGTAADGSSTTIQLAGTSTDADIYNDYNINIYGGNARYNTSKITDYVSDRTATVATMTDKGYGNAAASGSKYILGAMATDFEINDITIIYRAKRVK